MRTRGRSARKSDIQPGGIAFNCSSAATVVAPSSYSSDFIFCGSLAPFFLSMLVTRQLNSHYDSCPCEKNNKTIFRTRARTNGLYDKFD